MRSDDSQFDVSMLTRKNLSVHYSTGQSTYTGYGRNKVHHYRFCYMTDLGNIEQGEWRKLAEALVVRENGEAELQKLINDTRENCPWLKTDELRREYALQLYMNSQKKPS